MQIISLPHPNTLLKVEPLDYPNPYDFKEPHRHDYFEVILVKKGGGEQLIDFNRTGLQSHSIYVVYPRQIHLLNREEADGMIIQFKKEIFDFVLPLQHHNLYFSQPALTLSSEEFNEMYDIAQRILSINNSESLSYLTMHKSYSYLQIFLISLIEHHQQHASGTSENFAGQFLHLVSQHIRELRKVTDYADMLNVSAEKLTSLCKESFGTTPLKIIHEELVLEIKRSLVLHKLSLKEIAYELNFESSSNFSAFVKNATGLPPTDLQESLKTNLW